MYLTLLSIDTSSHMIAISTPQVITERPITWCNDADQPISIIGDINW